MAGHFGKYIGASLAVFFAVGLTSAQAQDCPPLTKYTSVKLEPLANSRKVLVPVTINDVPKTFLLDTAGIAAYITKESADELKLQQIDGMRNFVKNINRFGLGSRIYQVPQTRANDTTLVAAEYPVSSDRDGDIDGTLTTAFLFSRGELDIDFPGGTLSLFSPDHCPGKVNYWGAPDMGYLPLSYDLVGLSINSLPGWITREMTLKMDTAHLTVPATLDGHALNAWIDTSAEKSSISLEVAERLFKLPREQLGPLSEMKVTPEAALGFYNPHILRNNNFSNSLAATGVAKSKVYRHKFSGLTLGHIDIKNLELLIIPDRWGRNNDTARRLYYMPDRNSPLEVGWTSDIAGQGDNRAERSLFSNERKDIPDMVLGMDVLRHLHIYLSLKEKRMYFSTGVAPPAPAPAAAQ